MKLVLRLPAAALCILGLVMAVPGQAPGPPGEPQQPVLRVTTRLVQVNVIVQDRKGQPVAGLKQDEFVLLENGKERKLAVFSETANLPREQAPEPPPPRTSSNRQQRKAGTPNSLTIILLDGLNTRFEHQAEARAGIIHFLRQLRPDDRIAIYTLGAKLRVLHDFTSDTASLLRTLDRMLPPTSPLLEASRLEEPDFGPFEGAEAIEDFIREINQRAADSFMVQRVQATLRAVEEIARRLARFPGRKNLVWVSGGFPNRVGYDVLELSAQRRALEGTRFGNRADNVAHEATRRSFFPDMQRASRAVTHADVAIYPIDARGLLAPFDADPQLAPGGKARIRIGPPDEKDLGERAAREIAATHETMVTLADLTGGEATYNSADFPRALRRVVDDSLVTYVLGYYPSSANWDGKFREIKVQVKREGLRVRHRKGYFAMAEQPPDEKERKEILRTAAWSPLEATGLSLTVRLASAGGGETRLEIELDPRQVTFEPQGNAWVATLDLTCFQRSVEGKVLHGMDREVALRLEEQRYRQIMEKGAFGVPVAVSILAEASELRVAVRDRTGGLLGSVIIPLARSGAKT